MSRPRRAYFPPSCPWKLTYTGQLLALATAYIALGVFGLTMVPAGRFATLAWPPTGISLAALLLGGYRLWPAVAFGAFVTNLVTGVPPAVALGVAVGNTGEAVVGTFALRSIPGFSPALERVSDIVGLVVLAGMVSTIVSATIGVASLRIGGIALPESLGQMWISWWTGNLLGDLIIAPLLLTWACSHRLSPRPSTLAEGALVGVVLAVLAAILFLQPISPVTENPILLPYVLFLPLIWTALRFGVRGTATGMFFVAFAAVWGTHAGHGFFFRLSKTDSLFSLDIFLIAASLVSLFLGATFSELHEKAAVLRGIIDETPDALFVKDRRGRYVITNAACARLLGVRAEAPESGDDAAVFTAEEARLVREDDREVLQTGQTRTFDERLTFAGERRSYRTTKAPYRDRDGQVIGVIGVSRDVTAQKRADEERAQLLVREQAACAAAQDATRAKDEFLSVLSHELRTPLQSMLGWTQMLRAPGLDPCTVRKGQEAIERNLKMQLKLIEDLLDVSRIVEGKLRLTHQRVDLADIVESAVSSARAAVEAKAICMEAAIEPMNREVLGDPLRLQQVVSNLLSNAVKFTPSGGHIRVRLQRDGTVARIVVEDSGCGISPEFLPRVFDRLRQEDCTEAPSCGGLGLGLTIVRHLIELQGGTVRVASPGRGRGATFTLTLPLISGDCAAVATTLRRAHQLESADPAALAGTRVLVVDDDPDACDLLETVLRAWGAEVSAVQSARAALAALHSFRPDVLMSDIGMPEVDGYSLVCQVREREALEGRHIPAVALSAFASQADRDQALALGFEAHLAKPASPGDLVMTVARLAGRVA